MIADIFRGRRPLIRPSDDGTSQERVAFVSQFGAKLYTLAIFGKCDKETVEQGVDVRSEQNPVR